MTFLSDKVESNILPISQNKKCIYYQQANSVVQGQCTTRGGCFICRRDTLTYTTGDFIPSNMPGMFDQIIILLFIIVFKIIVMFSAMNSMKLVVPLRSLYWSIHTKDESKRGTAFAFIFGVN